MLKSLSLCVVSVRQSLTNNEAGRIVQRSLPAVSQFSRSLHLSAQKQSDKRDKPSEWTKADQGKKPRQGRTEWKPVNGEIRRAAINAAKSLKGDWTRAAEDLLARLKLHQSPDAEVSDTKIKKEPSRSLLQTMDISRSFSGRLRGGQLQDPSTNIAEKVTDDDLYARSVHYAAPGIERRSGRVGMRIESYTLYSAPRLGIFDAEKMKKENDENLIPGESDDLWVIMNAENARRALGGLPRNGFEEMIQWTKEGKLWKFPVDNEADMDKEKKYRFQDHIFLEHHLTEFPDKGPIRKFMELVVLGLSKNPWITVPEKVEHIQWFAQYFRQKQDILETSIGEEGKMKLPDGQLE